MSIVVGLTSKYKVKFNFQLLTNNKVLQYKSLSNATFCSLVQKVKKLMSTWILWFENSLTHWVFFILQPTHQPCIMFNFRDSRDSNQIRVLVTIYTLVNWKVIYNMRY